MLQQEVKCWTPPTFQMHMRAFEVCRTERLFQFWYIRPTTNHIYAIIRLTSGKQKLNHLPSHSFPLLTPIFSMPAVL